MNDLELRTRVAALDPAPDLPPLDDADRGRLLAAASQDRRRPRRATRRWGIGLAGGLVGLGVAATAVALSLPAAPGDSGPGLRTVTLSMTSDATAMCMPVADVAAEALAGSTVALAGTVDAVDGERIDVRVDRLYRGDPVAAVVLQVPANVEDPTALPVGEHVLIAATDGRVLGCGLSGAASPELQRFYDAAF